MSFAQGLSSGFAMGTQLGNTIQDRRYAKALTAQEEEYKRLMEAGQAPTPGAGQVTETAAPTAVVPGVGIAVPGAAAPEVMQATYDQGLAARQVRPPSQIERLQAQLLLAAQYGRMDELKRLDSLIAQQSQFDAQQAEQNRRFGLEQDRFNEMRRQYDESQAAAAQRNAVETNLKAAFDARNYLLAQERQGIAQSAEKREADTAAAEQAVRTAQDAYANSYNQAVSSGNYAGIMNIPEGVDPGAWQRVVYENLERDLGVSRQQLTRTGSRLSESVNSLVNKEFENPQEQFQAWQGLVNELYDSDYSDGVPVEIVDIPINKGGGFLIREGNREIARVASLDELGAMAQGVLEKDPLGAALGVELNARSADARAQARFERDLEVLKLQAPDKRAAIKALSDLKSDLTWGGISAADKIIRENEIRALWGLPLLKGAQGLTQQQNDPLSSVLENFSQAPAVPGGLAGR